MNHKILPMSIAMLVAIMTTKLQAQISLKENRTFVEDSTELKLNSKATQELNAFFEQNISAVEPSKRINLATIEEKSLYEQSHLNLISNKNYIKLPTYEQFKIADFSFRVETNLNHSSYLLSKYIYSTYTINKRVKFYIKGNIDLLRLYSTSISNNPQSIYLGAGLSFKLKEQESFDLGVKYALEPQYAKSHKKWNSLMDCTLHF